MSWQLIGAIAGLVMAVIDLIIVTAAGVFMVSLLIYSAGGEALLSRPIEQQMAAGIGFTTLFCIRSNS